MSEQLTPAEEAVNAVARKLMDAERESVFTLIEEDMPPEHDCPGQTFDPPCGSCGRCERDRWENRAWDQFDQYQERARVLLAAARPHIAREVLLETGRRLPHGAAIDLSLIADEIVRGGASGG